jgi:hypothetical protein
LVALGEDDGGDQVTADHEKDVDPNETAGKSCSASV